MKSLIILGLVIALGIIIIVPLGLWLWVYSYNLLLKSVAEKEAKNVKFKPFNT